MVQFRHKSKAIRNDYWKLDSGIGKTKKSRHELLQILALNEQHLKYKKIARLRELYIRRQRGLISYEKLTVCELKSFVVHRGLSSTATTEATAVTLRAQLEQADNDATFDRFSDLPSELRQQIFKHYFDSFDHSQMSEPGGQPPITFVSRQTRLEALPLYYSHYHFRLSADYYWRDWSDKAFISYTSAHHFARIRNFMASDFRCRYHDAMYTVDISVSLHDAECSAKVFHISPDDDDGDKEVVANNVN